MQCHNIMGNKLPKDPDTSTVQQVIGTNENLGGAIKIVLKSQSLR